MVTSLCCKPGHSCVLFVCALPMEDLELVPLLSQAPFPDQEPFTMISDLFLRFYLFILERGGGREKEWEGNIDVWEKHRLAAPLMCPNPGPGLQPRHVPWQGIEPGTFHIAGWCPTSEPHWPQALSFRRKINAAAKMTRAEADPHSFSRLSIVL